MANIDESKFVVRKITKPHLYEFFKANSIAKRLAHRDRSIMKRWLRAYCFEWLGIRFDYLSRIHIKKINERTKKVRLAKPKKVPNEAKLLELGYYEVVVNKGYSGKFIAYQVPLLDKTHAIAILGSMFDYNIPSHYLHKNPNIGIYRVEGFKPVGRDIDEDSIRKALANHIFFEAQDRYVPIKGKIKDFDKAPGGLKGLAKILGLPPNISQYENGPAEN